MSTFDHKPGDIVEICCPPNLSREGRKVISLSRVMPSQIIASPIMGMWGDVLLGSIGMIVVNKYPKTKNCPWELYHILIGETKWGVWSDCLKPYPKT